MRDRRTWTVLVAGLAWLALSSGGGPPMGLAGSAADAVSSGFIVIMAEAASASDTVANGASREGAITERAGARESVLNATYVSIASAIVEAATASDTVGLPVWTDNTDDDQTWVANTSADDVWTDNSHVESTWTEN